MTCASVCYKEAGRYFDGRLLLMFMRNSIKLLGSFQAFKDLLLLAMTLFFVVAVVDPSKERRCVGLFSSCNIFILFYLFTFTTTRNKVITLCRSFVSGWESLKRRRWFGRSGFDSHLLSCHRFIFILFFSRFEWPFLTKEWRWRLVAAWRSLVVAVMATNNRKKKKKVCGTTCERCRPERSQCAQQSNIQ